MGKWTQDYYDEQLNRKIKSLVTGAIERAKLEKTEPVISYEAFVEDLDSGDSFTTGVVEILMKELAERRTRNSILDRRLIADRTAKNLRLLATPIRIYRDGSHRRLHAGRRASNLSEFLTNPPDGMAVEDDDDEFDNMLQSQGLNVEGARMNSELYDAYGPTASWSTNGIVFSRRNNNASPIPPPLAEARVSTPRSQSPVVPPPAAGALPSPPIMSQSVPIPRLFPNPTLPITATSLSRTHSLRRPQRSRTTDFADFATRRRTTNRDRFHSRPSEDSDLHHVTDRVGQPTFARRFFPPRSYGWAPSNESLEVEAYSLGDTAPNVADWYMPHIPPSAFHGGGEASQDSETSDERSTATPVPRLRRGGIRAPEAILPPAAQSLAVREDRAIVIPSSPVSDSTETSESRQVAAYPTPTAENEG